MVAILKYAADQMSNYSCNDYFIPDTPENREFLIALHVWADDEAFEIEDAVHGNNLCCMDWMVLDYIAYLVEEENK